MVKMSQAIVVYDTYPHIDYKARGFEASEVIVKVINEEIKPKMALCKPPLMPIPQRQWTSEGERRSAKFKDPKVRLPMAKVMKLVHQVEKDPRIISASAAAGFAYADVPDAGFSAIVVSDGDDELARQKAGEIANLAWRLRKQFIVELPTADEAVSEAIAYQRKKRKGGGPVILADVGDNVGGGTPGDGTVILKSLIKQRAEGVVVVIADTESVESAIRTGVRNRLKLKVGGKTDGLHGEPVEIEGYVKLISDGIFVNKGQMRDGIREDQGKTAVVEGDGIMIILTERKLPTWNLQQLRAVGIEPIDQKIIVAKSAVAFRAAFEPIASKIIEVDTPGLTCTNLKAFNYKRLRRPIFPLDDI
jgi:microcystin degradation protein MlrC